jgi:hypothetical protein
MNLNFERGKDPKEALVIGRKEYALQMAGLLAKRVELTLLEENHYPNNPEIIFSWRSPKGGNGSYISLIEKDGEYSITYDLGLFNYGNDSIEGVVEALKKDGFNLQ